MLEQKVCEKLFVRGKQHGGWEPGFRVTGFTSASHSLNSSSFLSLS